MIKKEEMSEADLVMLHKNIAMTGAILELCTALGLRGNDGATALLTAATVLIEESHKREDCLNVLSAMLAPTITDWAGRPVDVTVQ